jgi:glycosyltransferase involved in cell wall biosynthesis
MSSGMESSTAGSPVDVSVVLTCHREGVIAHPTMRAIERARAHSHAAGLVTELIVTLDRADEETARVVGAFPRQAPGDRLLRVDCGDLGEARNAAIAAANGRYVAICDGDDYYAQDWFTRCEAMASANASAVVLHPELVVFFDQWHAYTWQRSQSHPDFDPDCLLTINPWNSCCFARREVFLRNPYVTARPGESGFGYEDWHWNCQTIADGHEHLVVPRSVHFVRRKTTGSLNAAHASGNAIIAPTAFFDGAGQVC